MEYAPFIKGAAIAVFLSVTMDDANIKNYKWWVAMLSLNVMASL